MSPTRAELIAAINNLFKTVQSDHAAGRSHKAASKALLGLSGLLVLLSRPLRPRSDAMGTETRPSRAELIEAALRAWVDWCAESEGKIDGAIQIATIHGCPYTGKPWPLEQTTLALMAPAHATSAPDVAQLREALDAIQSPLAIDGANHMAAVQLARRMLKSEPT